MWKEIGKMALAVGAGVLGALTIMETSKGGYRLLKDALKKTDGK